jgi:cytochrome c553
MGVGTGRLVVVTVGVVALASVFRPTAFQAQFRPGGTPGDTIDLPSWLFPLPSPSPDRAWDTLTPIRVPRSRVALTENQLHDLFYVPDWLPQMHPTMPAIVARGRKPDVYACGFCHLANGLGRPENAMIAGLPVAYIVQQLADMKAHRRRGAHTGAYAPNDNMQRVAENATDAEVAVAAAYFAALRPHRRVRVVEASRVPRMTSAVGTFRYAPGRETESLDGRLLEVPADFTRHEHRDPSVEYIAYVPVGSVARGRALASSPVASGLLSCTGCHGPQLKGIGLIPPLAGRSPGYLVRQLTGFKTGARATAAGAAMGPIAAALSLSDMIAVAAYAATLRP